MKKITIVLLILCLITAGCSDVQSDDDEHSIVTSDSEDMPRTVYDEEALNQTLSDWVMGTDYGIESVSFDYDSKNVQIAISDENYAKFEHYDFDDIVEGIAGILNFYDLHGEYTITYSNGDSTYIFVDESEDAVHVDADKENNDEPQSVDDEQQSYSDETINLIFIHHSVGENWLNAGLNQMLNDSNIHVADTYYGWREMGDRTDTWDWPDWFNDDVMPTVYNEKNTMTAYNSISPAQGENTIIMFKSCYPNSEVGDSIEDEKQLYLSLLDYFKKHPEKMFVLITPPPMQHISNPQKTRELSNWLVSEDGWRLNYTGSNLYVFDLYNVLTAEDNHHMMIDGAEVHIVYDKSNTLHYDSWGDDHPSDEGSLKAAEEFVPLLLYWYDIFQS